MRVWVIWPCLLAALAPCVAVQVGGSVVQVDGLPAVGARVEFQRELLPLAYDDQQSGASATTDGAGRFQRDLPPGA